MYTLYYAPGSASLAVHWLLIDLGVPFELRGVDLQAGEQKRAEYLALNPNGVVPTLVIEGTPAYECAALLLILAERHPDAHLVPAPGTPARLAYYQWMVHLANTLQPAFRQWFYPQEAAGEASAEAARESARQRIESAWDRVDAELAVRGPWIAGGVFSAADFLATMLMRWSRNMPRPATEWPAIREYVARMKARPSFAELYRREGLTDWT